MDESKQRRYKQLLKRAEARNVRALALVMEREELTTLEFEMRRVEWARRNKERAQIAFGLWWQRTAFVWVILTSFYFGWITQHGISPFQCLYVFFHPPSCGLVPGEIDYVVRPAWAFFSVFFFMSCVVNGMDWCC